MRGFQHQGRQAAANRKLNHSANEREFCTQAPSAALKSQKELPVSVAPGLLCSDGEVVIVPSSGADASHLSYIGNYSSWQGQFN